MKSKEDGMRRRDEGWMARGDEEEEEEEDEGEIGSRC